MFIIVVLGVFCFLLIAHLGSGWAGNDPEAYGFVLSWCGICCMELFQVRVHAFIKLSVFKTIRVFAKVRFLTEGGGCDGQTDRGAMLLLNACLM